jgi:hypothetical protein
MNLINVEIGYMESIIEGFADAGKMKSRINAHGFTFRGL